MLKHQFLEALRAELSSMPEEELGATLEYYAEMIVESGMTDAMRCGRAGFEQFLGRYIRNAPVGKNLRCANQQRRSQLSRLKSRLRHLRNPNLQR